MTSKEIVLQELSKNPGATVSGEFLAQKCNVSRAAVWKSITSLRNQGCNISGTTNGGYVLNQSPDFFSLEEVTKNLTKKFPKLKSCHMETFREIDSTNTYAKGLLNSCCPLRDSAQHLTEAGKKLHKSIFIAESQTAGRGRSGRSFVSPVGTGIYISIVYAPENGIRQPARMTASSAVAICRVFQRLYGIESSIKWINDIFVNGKKTCGILTEGIANFETGTIESAVIGIGINIRNNKAFSENGLSKIAGYLECTPEMENKVNRAELSAEIAGEVISILEEDPAKVMEEYRGLSFLIGQTLQVHSLIDDPNCVYTAKAIDIDSEAALIVKLPDGTKKRLISGEVTLKSSAFTKN